MKSQLLLKHFDRISDAPDAIPRLRRFILDLAVRGKLVEQDPNDEHASLLLKRIKVEREKLVKEGVIKRQEAVPSVEENYEPFSIPNTWVWTRLGQIGDWGSGSTPPRGSVEYYGGEITWLKSGELNDNPQLAGSEETVTEAALSKGSFRRNDVGDVLIAMYGATIGKVAILAQPAVTNQAVCGCTPFGGVFNRYLFMFLRSQRTEIQSASEGGAQPNISKVKIVGFPFPLPPLAEQHRIVAKVNELMALCDQLDAARSEGERRSSVLAAASIHHLNNGRTADTFSVRANFCIHHLPRLTSRIKHVAQLRQALMTLGVSGQLNTQNSEDEPASKLLSRKAQLPVGYQRRRKILKHLSVGPPAEILLQLPSAWEYRNVQNLYDLNVITDYADGNHGSLYPRANEFGDSGVTFVTAKDLSKGKVIWSSCGKLNNLKAQQLTKGWAKAGDVLLTHNATVGRVAQVEPGVRDFLLGTSVTFYRLNADFLDAGYFSYFLQSRIWQGQLEAIMQQTTRNQVSIQKQAFFLVAIPPRAEQHRIVAKVDELMALCDGLEAQLSIAQTESRRLLDAVLNEALNDSQTETLARLTVDTTRVSSVS